MNAAERSALRAEVDAEQRRRLEAAGGKAAVEKAAREMDRRVSVTYEQLVRKNHYLEEQLILCRRRFAKAQETIARLRKK